MGLAHSPRIVTNGLVLALDAANSKSYPGSGTTWSDIINRNVFAGTNYTYPSIGGSDPLKYFTFVNNGSTVNNIYSSTTITSTSTQTLYTRIAWFYLTSLNGAWSPIFQNSIGNNSDMALTVSAGGKIQFYQYTNSGTNGTTSGDYGVSGSITISTNTWYQAAIVVDRTSNNLKIYVNGALDTNTSINVIGNSNSNEMVIGGATVDSYSGDRMFKGRISQIFHYNRILSGVEITQNFNAYRGRYGI